MASHRVTLKIIPFCNPSGHLAYRVSGTICGERIQKNFPTQAEAEVFMNGLLRAANQGQSSRQQIMPTNFSSERDLRDAESAWFRLREADPKATLSDAVAVFLTHTARPVVDLPVAEAIEKFLERRRGRGNRDNTVEVTGAVLGAFVAQQHIFRVSEFNRDRAERFIFDTKVVARTRRDRRDLLHNWAEFLVERGLLLQNFVTHIKRPRVESHGEIAILRVPEVQALLDAAAALPVGRARIRGAMLPYFATCVLSGVRPDEAKRLRKENFSLEKKIIVGFKPKTTLTRTVELPDNLVAILQACAARGLERVFFSRRAFDAVRTQAGIKAEWDNDILRHTYSSHHYACRRDLGYLIKNMGNSETVLHQSYLNETVLAADGESLFAVRPSGLERVGEREPGRAGPAA